MRPILPKVMSREEIAVVTYHYKKFPDSFHLEFALLSDHEDGQIQKIMFNKTRVGMSFNDAPDPASPELMNKIVKAAIDNKLSAVIFSSKHKPEGVEFNASIDEDKPVFEEVRTKLEVLSDADPKRFALLLESFSSHVATRLSSFSESSALTGSEASDFSSSSTDEEVPSNKGSKWEAMSALENFPVLSLIIEYFVAFFTKLLAFFSYEQKGLQDPLPPIFRP
jgi:hypothetical protein